MDTHYQSWMSRRGLPVTIFIGSSPLRYPFFTLLVNGVVFLILAPALVCVIVGSIFKIDIAFTLMAVYSCLLILAFFVVLVYAITKAIKSYIYKKKMIKRYLDEHPNRK